VTVAEAGDVAKDVSVMAYSGLSSAAAKCRSRFHRMLPNLGDSLWSARAPTMCRPCRPTMQTCNRHKISKIERVLHGQHGQTPI